MRIQHFVADAGEECWVIDLVAIEVQDRQHCSISDRIEELVAVPAGGERPGFGLPITDHYQSDKVWIVVDGSVRVRDAVTKFTAFVNAAGSFRSGVTANSTRERKLFEETLHPSQVLALV